MNDLHTHIDQYLFYCEHQKMLNDKTLHAYRIDLAQFEDYIRKDRIDEVDSALIEDYLVHLHQTYQPKTVKRKIASIKAFFHYLEFRDILKQNPFRKVQVKYREPIILPKIIPLNVIETLLQTVYAQRRVAATKYQRRNALRDAAVLELLFGTGMRISEVCSLKPQDMDLENGVILIHGKGAKERRLQIGNQDVANILTEYADDYSHEIDKAGYFFVNQSGHPYSDQAVRRMISKYASLSGIGMHITPHMFRHTFATSLLESDVDIRYIQEMLGHSSITITEIYTHVATAKQRDILRTKHPRNHFRV